MNRKRLVVVAGLGFGLLLALLWAANTLSSQAQNENGGDAGLASYSKRAANLDRSSVLLVSSRLSTASVSDGGFENGPDSAWTEYSAQGWPLVVSATTLSAASVTPHSGNWAVWLGGDNDEVAAISQTVAITAGGSTLNFWTWLDSEDLCGYDFGSVLINNTEVYSISLCDTTNTGGWADRALDLSAYIGQNVVLEFAAETDDSYISNFFIDDVALGGGTGGGHGVFLPAVSRDFCSAQFVDDFGVSDGRWPLRDESGLTAGYLNGEYQILLKTTDSFWWATPDLALPSNYRIEVDVRQVSTAKEAHGLIFGRLRGAGGAEMYAFYLDAVNRMYLLQRANPDDTLSTLIDWTFHSAVSTDSPNHLRVDRVGTLIRLYVNGVQVDTSTDASYTSAGRDAGVVAVSSDGAPVDTRFDNFSATCLP
jgi:Immune inhibitor A-like, MAM domain